MILGCHVNFNEEQLLGSTKQAVEYGANTFMFYTGAPQNTVRKPLSEDLNSKAKTLMNDNGIDINNVICHAPYIINLANNKDQTKWDFSISFLKQELTRCKTLGIKYIVVHPGNSLDIPKDIALKNIADALNLIITPDSPMILLETMAGKGSECGKTILELKTILNNVKSSNIGVCLDTCHLNDAGYDMSDFDSFIKEFDNIIGIQKIHCIHVNDSKNPLGSHKDRHENIGFGTIGFKTLSNIVNYDLFKNIPKILETPYLDRLYPPYKFEIAMLKSNTFNPNLLEEIRKFYK